MTKKNLTRTLKFSVNPGLIDKQTVSDKSIFARGWKSVEMTVEELVAIVHRGFAVSYQFQDEQRKVTNFLASDILEVDIDESRTISDALKDPVVKKHCAFLYTTASHSVDGHRFRLVFVLPRTITDPKELRAATTSLARRLGGDLSATDPARIFFGSSQGHFEYLGKEISEAFLAELIADGSVIPERASIAGSGKLATGRSSQAIDPDNAFKRGDGSLVKIKDVSSRVSVHCPWHHDRNPSAFIARNRRGSTFFHCSTCRLTRWMSTSTRPEYDFDSFIKTIKTAHTNKAGAPSNDGTLADFLPSTAGIKRGDIHFTQEQFLHLKEIEQGLTFIKSPKGSGKTSYLSEAIGKAIFVSYGATLEQLEESDDPESPTPTYSDTRVLLIGHRQALIRDLAKRLSLYCYLDDPPDKSETKRRKARYAVCLDSLWRVDGLRYDVLVIDEVEQVLAHFLSETIGEQRWRIFYFFEKLVRETPRIVALDADLGWSAFTTLTDLKGLPQISKSGKTRPKRCPVRVYINEWIPPPRDLFLYSTQGQLVGHLMQAVFSGKRVFVCSNSKEKVKTLERAIVEKASQLESRPPKVFTITSENSREAETQEFITNIKTRILDYDVILSSPSLGTGVDITFEGAQSKIDLVYGLFENQINSHTEIDQQLARVRHPGEVHVWVSPRKFNFETEFQVVKQDYLEENLHLYLFRGDPAVATNGNNRDAHALVNMAALILANQRASKNRLKENFIAYKEANAWRVIEVPPDIPVRNLGQQFFASGKTMLKDEDIQRILDAPALSYEQYAGITERLDSNNEYVSRAEFYSLWRTKMELFYQTKITREIVERDKRGAYREYARRFLDLSDQAGIKEAVRRRRSDGERGVVARNRAAVLNNWELGTILLNELLRKTPIFKKGKFRADVEVSAGSLKEFAEFTHKSKKYVETQLEVGVRSDLKKKPTEQLGVFLKLVGLSLTIERTQVVAGQKVYFYKLTPIDLAEMEAVVEIRRQVSLGSRDEWGEIRRIHGLKSGEELEVPEVLRRKKRSQDRLGCLATREETSCEPSRLSTCC